MKTNVLVFIFLLSYTWVKSQDLCRPGVFSVKKLYQHDTLINNCDTAYYMGKHTFQVYHNLYEATRNNEVRRLADAYDRARIMYESRIEEQANEYQALQKEFEQMYAQSQEFLKAGMAANDSIKVSISLANKSLENANNSIEQLNETLKQERRNSTKTKLAIGGGAGVLGLFVGLLIR